nr:transposase [Serratia symbiotica]
MPKLDLSQQNLFYFASFANFYTVHDLRKLKTEQTYLYLLCFLLNGHYTFISDGKEIDLDAMIEGLKLR